MTTSFNNSRTHPLRWLLRKSYRYYPANFPRLGDLSRYRKAPILAILHGKPSGKPRGKGDRFILLDVMDAGTNLMQLHRGKVKFVVLTTMAEAVAPPVLKGDAVVMSLNGEGTLVYRDKGRYWWYPWED